MTCVQKGFKLRSPRVVLCTPTPPSIHSLILLFCKKKSEYIQDYNFPAFSNVKTYIGSDIFQIYFILDIILVSIDLGHASDIADVCGIAVLLSMEQDDRSYHTADRSSRSYPYAGQPHHVRGVQQTYYELAPLMEHSLSTHYPESSQRSITHSTSYSSTYDPSPFRGQSYDPPDDPFDNNSFQHTSTDHTPSHVLHPFSDLAIETNSSALRAETEIYTPSTPRTAEVGRAYAPNASFISQHNTSTNHFAFSSMPSNAYVQVAQPSTGCATGPAVAEEIARHLLKRGQMSHVHYTGELAQAFTPRPLPFDRKHMYTRKADTSDASAPDPPVKLADLDDPHPSLSLSHQFPDSNAGTSTPLPEDPVPPPVAIPKKKKSKMHDCEICHKKFPR